MEEKIKTKRIGTFTFGVVLILIGILSAISLFLDFGIIRFAMMLWPLFLVSLGVETLYYSSKSNIVIKYDVWNVILTTMLIGFTVLLSIGNFAVNEIFFKNENMQKVIEKVSDEFYDELTERCDERIETGMEEAVNEIKE